jgi:5-methylcytosine-specific restriction endonuclease McrA
MRNRNYKKTEYRNICPVCDKYFITTNHNQKYCSNECFSRGYRHLKSLQLKLCLSCGNEFLPTRENQIYCSKSCINKLRRGNTLILTNLSQREYFLEKANGCCEKCGKSSGEFHLHHIIPLHRGGFHEENNIIVLCIECHRKEHLIY